MTRLGRDFFIICLSLLVPVTSACTRNEPLTATQTVATPGGTAEMFRPVTDVPIPNDASLDPERSLILSGRDDWTGRIVMVSSVGATEAYAFYRAEMPKFEWSPVMSVQSAISVLSFTRRDRAATVQIERRTLGGTTVIITVARNEDTVGSGSAVQSAPFPSGPVRGN